MVLKKKSVKKNPLSKAQTKLLKDSLKRLLGNGLLEEPEQKSQDNKSFVLKNAINLIVLD